MKRKIIIFVLLLLPAMFIANFAGVSNTSTGVLTYLSGFWKLDQLYVNQVRVDSSYTQGVEFAFDLPNNKAYMLRDNNGIEYALAIKTTDTLTVELHDPDIYLPQTINPLTLMYSYKVIVLNSTSLIIIGKAKDSQQSTLFHDVEYRFTKQN